MVSIGRRFPILLFICLLSLAGMACSMVGQSSGDVPADGQEMVTNTYSEAGNKTAGRTVTATKIASSSRTNIPAASTVTQKPKSTITPLVEPTEETGMEIPGKYTWTPSRTPVNTKVEVSNSATGTPSPTISLTKTIPVIAPTSTNVPSCRTTSNPQYEIDLLNQINDLRARQSPPAAELVRNDLLDEAALRHSKDMACTLDWFDQKGSDGSTLYDRIDDAGYDFSAAAQNIYESSSSGNNPESAFNTWINMQTYNDNMIDPTYTEVGIGYASNPSSTYEGYFTAVFAAP